MSDLTRAGFDATHLLRSAAAAGPLPDDHPAAALWWRILDQLPQTPNPQPPSRPSDQAHPRASRATRAALDAASGVRPEPLTQPSTQKQNGPRFPQGPLPIETRPRICNNQDQLKKGITSFLGHHRRALTD